VASRMLEDEETDHLFNFSGNGVDNCFELLLRPALRDGR